MSSKKKSKNIQPKKGAEPSVSNAGKSFLSAWMVLLPIIIVTFIVFSPALHNGFVNWDDPDYVTKQKLVESNTIPINAIFHSRVASNYHPLTMLSLALNYQIGKVDPFGYHLVNIILHLFNTALVFFFLFILTKRNLLMAAIAGLFFGIHPMHVESVAWVSERKDVLYVFFFMAGLITYLQFRKTKKFFWYGVTILLFILSCLSKGMAVVFAPILLLIDYLLEIKWEPKVFLEKIPFFLLSLVFGIIAFTVQRKSGSLHGLEAHTTMQRFMFASYGLIIYVVKFFIPYNLAVFYPYPHSDTIPVIVYLCPLILIGAATLIFFFMQTKKPIIFGLLFYFLSVALVLQFISVGSAMYADRYSYLSYVGLLFVVAYFVNAAWQTRAYAGVAKYFLAPVLLLASVFFSYQTYARVQVWKSGEILWADEIEKYPEAGVGYEHLAAIDYDQKRIDKAFNEYSEAIQLNYRPPEAYNNRGMIYLGRGQYNLAIADFKQAIALDSNWLGVCINLGIYYDMMHQPELALAELNRYMASDTTNVTAYANRAIVYIHLNDYDKALKDQNKVVLLDPTNSESYTTRGVCYDLIGKNELALADFNSALKLAVNGSMLNCRGVSLLKLKNYQAAINDFTQAIGLEPSVGQYWVNRSTAEKNMGMKEEALNDALKAQQLGMNVDGAYLNSLK